MGLDGGAEVDLKWHKLKWKRPGMRKICVVRRGFIGTFRPSTFGLTGCIWRVEIAGETRRITASDQDEWIYFDDLSKK